MTRTGLPIVPAEIGLGTQTRGWPTLTNIPWQPVFNSMQAYSRSYGAVITAFNSEWFTFVNRRMKEDVALPQNLAACKAPDEVMKVYASFIHKTLADYQAEVVTLTKLGGDAAHHLCQSMAADAARDEKNVSNTN